MVVSNLPIGTVWRNCYAYIPDERCGQEEEGDILFGIFFGFFKQSRFPDRETEILSKIHIGQFFILYY